MKGKQKGTNEQVKSELSMKISAWITWRELAVYARTEGQRFVYVAHAFHYQSIITGSGCALCVFSVPVCLQIFGTAPLISMLLHFTATSIFEITKRLKTYAVQLSQLVLFNRKSHHGGFVCQSRLTCPYIPVCVYIFLSVLRYTWFPIHVSAIGLYLLLHLPQNVQSPRINVPNIPVLYKRNTFEPFYAFIVFTTFS